MNKWQENSSGLWALAINTAICVCVLNLTPNSVSEARGEEKSTGGDRDWAGSRQACPDLPPRPRGHQGHLHSQVTGLLTVPIPVPHCSRRDLSKACLSPTETLHCSP